MESRRERLLTAPFVLAGVANLLHGLSLNGYLHLPGFLEDLGAGEFAIGAIVGVMSGAAIVIRPLAGRVMDNSGRRIVILLGGLLHTLSCAMYLSVDSLGAWLIVVRILQGFSQGALFSSLFTYAADIVPASRRTQGIGLFGVSGIVPIALGGVLGDLVLRDGGYRELFLASAIISGAGFLASLPLREPERPRTAAGRGFFGAARQRDLVPIWVLGTSFAMALAGPFTFVKMFVEEQHVGAVGLFFSAYSAAAIVLRIFFGWVPDRYGKKRVLYPAILSIAAALALLAGARDTTCMMVAGIFAGLGHGFAFPILSAIVVTRAHPSDRGSAISLFTAIFDIGFLIGGPSLGLLASLTDLRAMFAGAACIPIVGAVLFFVWERERGQLGEAAE